MSESDEACEHYDAQVAVEIASIDTSAYACDWCGDEADYVLEKSHRVCLFLCQEDTRLIDILLGGGKA